MCITTLTQYKQDARISTEKCVAAHSAAGSWREQRARDAVGASGAGQSVRQEVGVVAGLGQPQ